MVVENNAEKYEPVVTFNTSYSELPDLSSLQTFCKIITAEGYKVAVNKGPISDRITSKSDILVFLCPRKPFRDSEILLLTEYVKNGGKVLLTDQEGKTPSHINEFLKHFGIEIKNDGVIRTQRQCDYLHPKESLIIGGVLNQAIQDYLHPPKLNKNPKKKNTKAHSHILYPYGCTLNAMSRSVPLLSTGLTCFPFSRPICALFKDTGKVIAFGSTKALSDAYIHLEDNPKLVPMFLRLLMSEDITLNFPDAQCPDLFDYTQLPNIGENALLPMSCLDTNDLDQPDISKLFHTKKANFDNKHLAKVIRAYKELGMEREQLRIIKPKFESPLPKLIPATVPPRFRGPSDPCLELYDLDECFMPPLKKLDSLTQKCSDEDLECYVASFGKLMQFSENVQRLGGKHVINHVCCELVKMKKAL